MPYILNEKRNKICPVVHGPSGRIEISRIDCAGDLNYAFTMLAIDYIKNKGLSYQSINDISGAFTEGLAEFRRRVTSNYENEKIYLNGDVYPSFETPKYPGMAEFNGS